MTDQSSQPDERVLEEFVCSLYSPHGQGWTDINKLRQEKLLKLAGKANNRSFPKIRKVNCAMLPPCRSTLLQKIKRAVYISRVWKNADLANPAEGLKPDEFGWKKEVDHYQPDWFEGPSLPTKLNHVSEHDADIEAQEDLLDDLQEAEWSNIIR